MKSDFACGKNGLPQIAQNTQILFKRNQGSLINNRNHFCVICTKLHFCQRQIIFCVSVLPWQICIFED